MADDDYEIVPFKEIEELKKQLNEIQKKSMDARSAEIVSSMEKLTEILESMLHFFNSASQGIRQDESSDKGEEIIAKLDEISGQNRTIAEGMVAIADLLKELDEAKSVQFQAGIPEIRQQPEHTFSEPARMPQMPPQMQRQMPQFPPMGPSIGSQQMPHSMPPMPPFPPIQQNSSANDLPNPPLQDKRGLFNRFK